MQQCGNRCTHGTGAASLILAKSVLPPLFPKCAPLTALLFFIVHARCYPYVAMILTRFVDSWQEYQRTLVNLLTEHLNVILHKAAAAYYEVCFPLRHVSSYSWVFFKVLQRPPVQTLRTLDTSSYRPSGTSRRVNGNAPLDPNHPSCTHGLVRSVHALRQQAAAARNY